MMTQPSVIGIDAGATRCKGALRINSKRFDVSFQGANANTDPSGALASVVQVLHLLAQEAGVCIEDMAPIPTYIAQAGITGRDQARQMRAGLPLAHVVIEEDKRASVQDALGDADGYVAMIGTGSFLAHKQGGTLRYLGGYGLILGDEASGAWAGREALTRALRANEGLYADDLFLKKLRERMGGPQAIMQFAARATPAEFAELFPVLLDEGTSPSAREILRLGARYITKGFRLLGWQEGERLCLSGGVGPSYTKILSEEMRICLSAPCSIAPDGALALAARVAEGWQGWE